MQGSFGTVPLQSTLEPEQWRPGKYMLAWVVANPADVTALLQEKGSTSTFPAPSIPRCSIVVTKVNNNAVKESIVTYLGLMVPAVDWSTVDLFM